MKGSNPRTGSMINAVSLVIGLLTTALVIAYVYYDVQDLAPGDLSAVHAQVHELAGPDNCASCHGGDGISMSMSCLNCHQTIERQLGEAKGIHGKLTLAQVDRCWDCHSEHHGSDFALTNRRSFELAGIKQPGKFDHSGLDFRLSGAHLDVSCDRCHPAAFQAVLDRGLPRYLGLSQDCVSCHQDTHRGTLGTDCASCHGQSHPFQQAAEFQHTSQFPLIGSHAGRACQDCHVPGTPTSVVELLQSPNDGESNSLATRSCQDCHASPHHPQFISSIAIRSQLEPGNSCQLCHAIENHSFSRPEAEMNATMHELTGFPLTSPHSDLTCDRCHGEQHIESENEISFARRYPGRDPDDCQICHGDPHQGEFVAGTQQSLNCLNCHERHSFNPSTFDKYRHDITKFPLRGAHFELQCQACHRSELPTVESDARRVTSFVGLSLACASCHRDPHFGQFEEGHFNGADCQVCHTEQSFRRTTFDERMHSQTRFPLDGAHAAVSCRECHPELPESSRKELPGADPSAALVARRFQGTSMDCGTCHADPHGGMFDRKADSPEPNRPADCSQCHTTESFREIKEASFDHSRWTEFELAGAHATLDCARCHGRSAKPNELGRTLGLASGRKCQDCHRDPHAGQFGPAESADCAKCHNESSFRDLRFDHQRDTAFPLDAQHVQLDCAACHRRYKLADGQIVTRYKPIGTACSDCHLPRNGNFIRRP